MRMNCADLLQQLNQLDEHQKIEAKEARKQIGRSVMETICAFANEPDLDGGYLLLGIERLDDELAQSYNVVGVLDPDKIQADLASQCASVFNHPIRPTTWIELLEGQQVVGVYVPEAPAGDKPIFFLKESLPRGAFRRIGSTDQRCTEDDLQVFYHDRDYRSFDDTPVEANLSDIDPQAIAEYRRARSSSNPEAEELHWDDSDLLESLGCATKKDNRIVLTVSGLILFGSERALRRLLPMMRVDYVRIAGREWIDDPDSPLETLEMRGPLLRLIPRAHATILDDLPRAFSIPQGQIQRKEEPLIPARVIREALVNAFMHRSYRVHGPVQIIRYANRLEIRNPGNSLVSPDRLGEPGSRTRNPRIAAALHDTRYAENKGSGIRIMRQLMKNANLSPPSFDSDREKDEFSATFLFQHFLGDADLSWLSRFRDDNLKDDEANILIFVREKGSISNADARNLTGLGTLEVSQRLRRLRDLNLLEKHDKGPATYYTPTNRLFFDGDPQVTMQRYLDEFSKGTHKRVTGRNDSLTQESNALTQESDALTQESDALTQESDALTQESNALTQGLEMLPHELKLSIEGLGRRCPRKAMEQVIIELCRWRSLRADELADIIGRKSAWIRRSYLSPMVQEGQLELTIPENPSHPRQAYRTRR